MDPELIKTGNAIDYELASLLGEKPADFLVLHFDGVAVNGFGTPTDTPKERQEMAFMVKALNDVSEESWWPQMFEARAHAIIRQFGLPPETTAKDYRPLVSFKIHRVVPGRSIYLHSAIMLFDQISDRLRSWIVTKITESESSGQSTARLVTTNGELIHETGECSALVICKAVVRALKSSL